jgi:hypothetical protein
MSSISTGTFPYTLAHVSQLLGLEESAVLGLCRTLGIRPHHESLDEGPGGSIFFGMKDFDLLKKAAAVQKEARRENRESLVYAREQLPAGIQPAAPQTTSKVTYGSAALRAPGMARADLSLIVDAVSNAKENILRDLSQLLDDKLSGLDEVVVELIRSKSENDALREEVRRLEENQNELQMKLSKFKPAAFGFYRKDN